MNVFFALLVAGVLAIGQMLLFKHAGHKGIWVDRQFSKTRLTEGERFELVETIENRRILPVPWLRIETRMPSELLFGQQENLEIGALRYHRSVFFMGPWQRVRRTHQVRAMHRGYYTLSSYAMTVGDLMGVSQSTVERSMNRALVVYPKLLSREEVRLPASRWQGEAVVKRFINPDLFLYNGIRDYRPGDLPRDVHWRAYARTGELKVKQHDFTAASKLLVLLNVVPRQNQWDTADEADKATVERGIRLAASLMCYALEDGLEVGFGSNGYAKPYEENTVYLPPASGAQQAELLLEVCARLVIRRVRPFHVFMGELPMPQDMDIVVISGYQNELMDERIAQMRARGNTVTVLPIDEGAAA
jgi:uncharacterized protein (DUF58 family)